MICIYFNSDRYINYNVSSKTERQKNGPSHPEEFQCWTVFSWRIKDQTSKLIKPWHHLQWNTLNNNSRPKLITTLHRLPLDEQMMVLIGIYNGVVIISRSGYPYQSLLHTWRKRRLKQFFPWFLTWIHTGNVWWFVKTYLQMQHKYMEMVTPIFITEKLSQACSILMCSLISLWSFSFSKLFVSNHDCS